MRIFFMLFFFSCFSDVSAQVTRPPSDRIFLNDSTTIYDGYIVEQAPAKYVRIVRIKEKDTVLVWMKDIWKMLRIYPELDAAAQEAPRPKKKVPGKNKYVFLEVLGSGGIYSVNYDFRFSKEADDKWGLRAGFAYLPVTTVNYSGDQLTYNTLFFPFVVSYLFGKANKFLELGLGAVYVFKFKNGPLKANEYEYFIKTVNRRLPGVYGTFSVGYRHIPKKGKIMWGYALTPLVGNSFILPSVSFKIGYAVK